MILSRMVNHYTALANIKPKVDTSSPFLGVQKTQHEIKKDINKKEEFRNVREAYKKVSTVKPYVDSNKPYTYDKKLKNCYKSVKEKYENMEHLRTLKAMSKRILSIGKMHERKKNKNDPVANPTYFFRNIQAKNNPNDEAIKLISLQNLNEKIKNLNENEKNKLLLGNAVYAAIQSDDKTKKRPKSAVNTNIKSKIMNKNKVPMYLEYDPEKYIKIHKMNREMDGNKIVKEHKKELEKNQASKITKSSKSKTLKNSLKNGLLNNKDIPTYNDNDEEKFAEDQFLNSVRQFIIENDVYSDEDFDILIKELIKKNKGKKIKVEKIRQIVLDIKTFLES